MNSWNVGQVRTAEENRAAGRKALAVLEKRRGGVTAARTQLSELSLLPVRNGTYGAPFGDQQGIINGACPPDMLHQFLLGLCKYVFLWVVEMISTAGNEGGRSGSLRLAELDRYNIPVSSHSLPRHHFTVTVMLCAQQEIPKV